MAEEINKNREIAIQLTGIKKRYRLGQIGGRTLQADIQSWWARKRGKEDPNVPIGQDQRLVGQSFMALNGIDLTIYKGEAFGIIGKNGAGKSTMLKLLARVTAPTEGTIDLYGRVTSMLEVGTGFNGEMTGRENIYMNGAILGMTKAEIDAKMEQIIAFSEVREFIDTPVKRYSSGMYVKLAFSVAAHLDSEIMIMDEVLAVGDMAFQKKCLDRMREAATQEGRTVLYVSHNMNTIRQLCDRCIVLDQGKLIFDGDVEEAIEVYMSTSKALTASYDYREVKRNSKDMLTGEVKLNSLTYTNKKDPIFYHGEPIQFEMNIESKARLENVLLRIIVKNRQGSVVGMANTSRGIRLDIGNNILSAKHRIDSLAPGYYSFKLVIYELGALGAFRNLDVIDDACAFEKVQREENNKMAWNSKWWGNVMLPEIELTKENVSDSNWPIEYSEY